MVPCATAEFHVLFVPVPVLGFLGGLLFQQTSVGIVYCDPKSPDAQA